MFRRSSLASMAFRLCFIFAPESRLPSGGKPPPPHPFLPPCISLLHQQAALLSMRADGSGHAEDAETMRLEGIRSRWMPARGGSERGYERVVEAVGLTDFPFVLILHCRITGDPGWCVTGGGRGRSRGCAQEPRGGCVRWLMMTRVVMRSPFDTRLFSYVPEAAWHECWHAGHPQSQPVTAVCRSATFLSLTFAKLKYKIC